MGAVVVVVHTTTRASRHCSVAAALEAKEAFLAFGIAVTVSVAYAARV